MKTYAYFVDNNRIKIYCCNNCMFINDFLFDTYSYAYFAAVPEKDFGLYWQSDRPILVEQLSCSLCKKIVLTVEIIKTMDNLYALSGMEAVVSYVDSLGFRRWL